MVIGTAAALAGLILLAPVAGSKKPVVRRRNPDTVHPPTGYTHLVEVSGGRTLYVAGQIALDRTGTLVGAGDFKAQARQVFENLKAVLAAGGAGFDDVVKITVFLTDISDLAAFREVRNAYFPKELPASTLVQVQRLARPELMLEVEAVAVVSAAP
jgi:reactive intermediate/imine deaminase